MTGNGVETGRIMPRRTYECHSCHVRNAIGVPRASDSWPPQLHLSEKQMDLLLVAAAEFREMCEECRSCKHGEHGTVCGHRDVVMVAGRPREVGEPCYCDNYEPLGWADAIAFLDWVRPDAIGRGFASPVNLSPEATSARHKGVA